MNEQQIPRSADTLVCKLCRTGLLVFVQTGVVDLPHVRVYRCNCCGAEDLRRTEPPRKAYSNPQGGPEYDAP